MSFLALPFPAAAFAAELGNNSDAHASRAACFGAAVMRVAASLLLLSVSNAVILLMPPGEELLPDVTELLGLLGRVRRAAVLVAPDEQQGDSGGDNDESATADAASDAELAQLLAGPPPHLHVLLQQAHQPASDAAARHATAQRMQQALLACSAVGVASTLGVCTSTERRLQQQRQRNGGDDDDDVVLLAGVHCCGSDVGQWQTTRAVRVHAHAHNPAVVCNLQTTA